jgi:hypothetical protein
MLSQVSRLRRRWRLKPEATTFARGAERGSGLELARACVESCWRAPFFGPGRGRDTDFELRELVRCRAALEAMGHGERLRENLDWTLQAWSRAGRVSSRISVSGEAYEREGYSCDALPCALEWIAAHGASAPISDVRELFEAEIERYFDLVFEPLSGELRRHRIMPGWRQGRRLLGSCEVVCQLASLQKSLRELGWSAPRQDFDARVALEEWFWTGQYYREDSVQHPARCGVVANVLPFALGLEIRNPKEKLRAIAKTFEEQGLNEPLPFRYERKPIQDEELSPLSWSRPGAQGAGASSLAALLWAKAIVEVFGQTEGALGAGLEKLEARPIVESLLIEVETCGTLFEERDSKETPTKGSRWDGLASSLLVELAETLSQGRGLA